MDIIVVGVSYQHTPLQIREKLAFSRKKVAVAYAVLAEQLAETVILSTCNRSEIYAVVEDGQTGREAVKKFFAGFHGLDRELMENYYYENENSQCVEHLFQVTAGLDSQVLGEDQILGQVKDAHALALEYKGSGKILNRLFQDGITVGKKIRETTKISQHPTSISYLAVQHLAGNYGDFHGKNLLLVGAGKMNRLALTYLKELSFSRIIVANRTAETAERLREVCPEIEVISVKELETFIPQADVVISSTSAPHIVVTKERAAGYKMGSVFLDLAVPRDIDPELGLWDGFNLVDLDVLEQVAAENHEKRRQAAEEARELVAAGVDSFFEWFNCLAIFPLIRQIESYHEGVLSRELPKLIGRLKNADSDQKMEVLLQGLVKKIYATPIIRLKEVSGQGDREDLAGLLTDLYREE